MLSGMAFLLGLNALVQVVSNYVFARLERKYEANAYETKKICRKTARAYLPTAIIMFIISFILFLLKK